MTTPIRRTVVTVTACAAGLSLAACTAGITTASRSPSVSRPSPTSAAPASRSPSPSPVPVDTVNIDPPLRAFPVPHGAQIISNNTCNKEIIIELGAVTVIAVSRFYNSVLPKNGYKITGNTLINTTGKGISGPEAEIQFTGHGYKGTIVALANLGASMKSAGISTSGMPSSVASNFITIDLIPPGAAGCPTAGPTGP